MAIKKWFGSSEEEMPSQRGEWSSPFRQLQGEMNRLFEDFFGQSSMMMQRPGHGSSGSMMQGRFSPRIDISEDTESVRITAEMPGMNKDDIEIYADEDSVTIRGEKRHEETKEDEGVYRSERSYGYFRRTIPLPVEVDTENSEAKFEKGVLNLRFPKVGEAKGKRLQIK